MGEYDYQSMGHGILARSFLSAGFTTKKYLVQQMLEISQRVPHYYVLRVVSENS